MPKKSNFDVKFGLKNDNSYGPRSKDQEQKYRKIFSLRRSGKTMQQIGDQFGISKQRVSYLIKQYNV